jgi:hypothetical protein
LTAPNFYRFEQIEEPCQDRFSIMSHIDENDNKPILRAALGGTAVALAMVGATLFWVSSQNKQLNEPLNISIKPEIAKPVQAVVLPNVNASPANDSNSITTPESAFSATPKKVKSLSIETKAD